ncbi:MAG: DNA polymerase III subunit gamma/tau, partial [Anaerolineaceae bacterium]
IEIDAASNTSVDDVRDLRDKIRFSPSMGKYKVYIIDEVHMLSTSAFNALLKTLEEPPGHAIFVLATTEIHKIPSTVLSRCQRHEFRRISVQDIVQQLEQIAAGEHMQISTSALTLVARQSTGAMRDAISLLDQLASTGEEVTVEYASNILGTATSQSVIEVVEDILQQNTAGGLEHLHTALDTGIDPRQYARQIVEYLRSILLAKMGNPPGDDLPADTRTHIDDHARRFEQNHLLFCIQRFNATAVDVRGNWQPSLGLELAFAETCLPAAQRPHESSAVPPQPAAYQPAPQNRQPAPRQTNPESRPSHEPPQNAPNRPAGEPKTETRTAAPQPHAAAAQTRQPAPTAEAVPAPAGSLDEKSTFRKLRDGWDEIRRQTRRVSPQVEGLINSCKIAGVNERTIQLGCNSDFVKSKLETKENLAIIEPILSRFLGEPVNVVCVVIKNNP